MSDSSHSDFRYGNVATTTCRSMKSRAINTKAIPKTVQAWRFGTDAEPDSVRT